MSNVNNSYISEISQAAIDSGFTPELSALIVAQAQVESANFSSNVFKSCNNCYGYKFVGQPNATSCISAPSNEGPLKYARYETVYDSAMEVCNWIKRNITDYDNIKTPNDYAYALKHSKIGAYYGSSTSSYALGLARYFKLVSVAQFVNKNPVTSLIIIGSVAVAMSTYIYFLTRKK